MDVQPLENLPVDSVASNSPTGSNSSSPSLPNGELRLKIRLKPPQPREDENATKQRDENVEDSKPCICGSAQNWGFMIGCDMCGLWLHGPCVSITEDQSKLIQEYHCPSCVAEHGPSKMLERDQRKPERKRKSQRNGTESKFKLHLKSDFVELPDDDSKELKVAKHFVSMMKERIPFFNKNTTIREDNVVKTLTAQEFNIHFLAKEGVRYPLLVEDKHGLGLLVPQTPFSVDDVASLVGHSRPLDVMEVSTQAEVVPQWTLGKWANYFREVESRTKVYNVISLEFSGTKLNQYVRSPDLVREIDWTSTVWPKDLPVWPKVQYYCLMSVGSSYTDFHIDFGGSSVWYHVVEGLKIFFFIPPTEHNLQAYAQWSTSADQNLVFFGDLVPDCYYAIVKPGQTLMVPTGWIHAVYTPIDSLVFGGNFLHSFNIGLQLKVYNIEEKTKVQQKFRFPMFEQINWYAADYLRNYLKEPAETRRVLSRWEYEGILTLVTVLDGWLTNSWRYENIPAKFTPDDAKQLVGELSQLILSENIEMENTQENEPWRKIIKENRDKEIEDQQNTINNIVKESNGNVQSTNGIHEVKRSFEKLVLFIEQQQLRYRLQTSAVVTTRSRAKRMGSSDFAAELEGSEDEDYFENDRMNFVDDEEEEAQSSKSGSEEDMEDEDSREEKYSRRSLRRERDDSAPLLTLDDVPKPKKKKVFKKEKVESPKIEQRASPVMAQSPPTTSQPPAAPVRPFEGLQPKKAQPQTKQGVKKRLAKKLGMKFK